MKEKYPKKHKRLSLDEIKIIEEKEKILKGKKLLSEIKTEEKLIEFLSKLEGENLQIVRKNFEYFFSGRNSFKELHDKFYVDEIKVKCSKGLLDYDTEMKKVLIDAIDKHVRDNAGFSTFEKREYNNLKKEQRKLLRQARSLNIRQADLSEEVEGIFDSTNFRSKSCRVRYRKACLRFVEWLVVNTGVKKLYNIKHEHLEGYVIQLYKSKRAKSYARTELYGVLHLERYINFRNELNKNKLLGVIEELWENQK